MAEAPPSEVPDSSTTYVQWLVAYDEALEVGEPPPALDQVPTEQRDRALHTAPLLHLLQRVRENQSSGEVTKTRGVPRTGRRPTQKIAPDGLPRRIGRFEITGYLGRGGMGIVYQGWDEQLRRPVAIKVLRDADPTRLSRFHAEAEMLAHLTHPQIVHVYETSVDAGQPYLVMELIPGWSLADVLRGRPVAAEESAALVELLAQTLHYAHRQGIIHRDLKPANVLLAPRTDTLTPDQPFQADAYEIHVSDFGLGRRMDSDNGLTKTGEIIGTPGYMAPEQAAGCRDQGPSVDVYALGAVLYEMLTGRPPFAATTGSLALYQVLHADPLPPSRLVVGLPRELESICLKCLHKNPAWRYASAEALALDLHRFRTGQRFSIRPPGVSQRIGRWLRTHLLATALAGLVVVAGVVFALLPPRPANQLDQELHQERSQHQQLREEFRTAREENKVHLQQAHARIDQTQQSLKHLLAILCQGTNEEALPVQELQALEHAEQLFRNEVEEAEIAQAKALLLAAEKEHLAEEKYYRQRQAHAHTWLGRIALQRNLLKPAEEHFRKAATATADSNGASSLDQLICHTWLAQFHLDRNQVQEAQGELRHCDRHALILNQESERSPEALLALIYHERFHARLAGQLQDLQVDADALVRQIALCRQLRQEKYYRRTATVLQFQACSFLGDTELKLHRLEAAERSLRDALTAARELCAETPASLEPRRYVALALYNLAKVLQGQGKPFEPDLRRAQDCYQRLVDDYSTSVPCRLGLAMTLDQIGLVEMGSNRLAQAEQTFRRSVDLFKKLVAERSDPPMDLLQSLGAVLCNLGSLVCDGGGRPREALPLFEEAINVLSKQGLPERGTVARQFLCNCWMNLGVAWAKLQHYGEAAESFENACGLAEGDQRERLRADRSRCLFRSGQTEAALKAVKEQVEEGHAGLGPLVNLAGTLAMVAQAEKNAKCAEDLKLLALKLLEMAEQAGLSRHPALRQALAENEEFAVLRARPAFRKLMQTKP